MKVVESTVNAAALIREIRGNAQFWLEKMNVDMDSGAQELRDHLFIMPSSEIMTFHQTIVNDANRALAELGEPHDAIPSHPDSAG